MPHLRRWRKTWKPPWHQSGGEKLKSSVFVMGDRFSGHPLFY